MKTAFGNLEVNTRISILFKELLYYSHDRATLPAPTTL